MVHFTLLEYFLYILNSIKDEQGNAFAYVIEKYQPRSGLFNRLAKVREKFHGQGRQNKNSLIRSLFEVLIMTAYFYITVVMKRKCQR